MFNGEITGIVMNDICSEKSVDGKYIKLTVYGIGECKTKSKQPNLIKRLFYKIFK